MKFLFAFVSTCLLCNHVFAQSSVEAIGSIEQSYQQLADKVGAFVVQISPNKEDTLRTSSDDSTSTADKAYLTSVLYDNYLYKGDTLNQNQFHKVSITKSVNLFDADFTVIADVFSNGRKIDSDRSGVALSFNPVSFLDRIKSQHSEWYQNYKSDDFRSIINNTPKLAQAHLALLLDKYIELINSPAYQQYLNKNEYDLVPNHVQTPSRINFTTTSIDSVKATTDHPKNTLTQEQQEIEAFIQNYKKILSIVQSVPFEVRQHAQETIDSLSGISTSNLESEYRSTLAQNPALSKFQKNLLFIRRLDIGSTQLGDDGKTTIGLPIRGINFEYQKNALSYEVQVGKRLQSQSFLPTQGVPFHNLDKGGIFARGFAGLEGKQGNTVNFSYLVAKRRPSPQDGTIASPTTNSVITVNSELGLSKILKATLHSSLSNTKQSRQAPSSGSSDDFRLRSAIDRSSVAFGAQIELQQLAFSLKGFRIGNNYQSYANPYLITDFQGVEMEISGNAFQGKLFGQFSISRGTGTEEITKNISRWQAFGLLRYQISNGISTGIMVTPNVFRQEVNNQDGFSKSNVYQFDITGQGKVSGKKMFFRFAATNLDQGWNWNDSTTVRNYLSVKGTISYSLTDKVEVQAEELQTLTTNDSAASEWYHSLTLALSGKKTFGLSLRYEKYRFEPSPGWGINLNAGIPLSENFTARISLYGHLSRTQDVRNIVSSQNSFFAQF